MQCAKCGYMMTAFDKTCPCCPQLKDYKECPRCHQFVRSAANACQECGYDYRPAPPPAPAPAPLPRQVPAFPEPRRAILPEHVLHCPVCGRKDTQKVSAIYQAGSWTESTSGEFGAFTGSADGPLFTTYGQTAQETHGSSRLASALAPPPRPQGGFNSVGTLIAAILLVVMGVPSAVISLPFCLILIGIPFLLLSLAMIVGGFVCLFVAINRFGQDAQARRDIPRWMQGMEVWSRLFYCGRCDSVFDPATGQAAPSH